ncbi:ubiquitin-like protein 7 isoform X2 [Halichondria panicea]|uniref:ubiquitin-like protein 7 isoform X2 n=1 Tax=Halichondria panicea TaxID=6063 RepID=UPI00312BC0F2
MSLVYLKQLRDKERKELPIETWEGLTVKELRETASRTLAIPLDVFTLIFNGRVLKLNNSISYYKITNSCTIFYTRKVTKASAPLPEVQEHSSSFNSLITNRRMLTVIGRILSNPSLLQAMLVGTPLEGNQALTDALTSPALLASLSDPDTIEEYLRENPHMAALMENMLRVYQNFDTSGEGVDGADGEGTDGVGQENMDDGREEQIRMAQQEEMFEHSQAIHAHQRQAQVTTSAQGNQPSMSQPSTQRQNSRGAITQDLLTSALAGAMSGSPQPSPLSSLDISNSGPPSLSSYPSHPTTQPVQASSNGGRSEQVGSISRQNNITSNILQQALASAVGNISTTSNSQREVERRLTPQEKYRAQLEQLHFMGILDDALSIQALDAAGGDIQAALEIIYTR